MKRCSYCGETKPLSEFGIYKSGRREGHPRSRCHECDKLTARIWKSQHREHVEEYNRTWKKEHPKWDINRRHQLGKCRPQSEAKDCPNYLGICVAERVLSRYFDKVTKMPTNNPGYDMVCGKGFKIDVKSACERKAKTSNGWQFSIARNKIADYFLCLAFDNRSSLNPVHVWLIPSSICNSFSGLWITDSDKGLKKYEKYERPLDKVISCCNNIKNLSANV